VTTIGPRCRRLGALLATAVSVVVAVGPARAGPGGGTIVFSATRLPSLFGEIYSIGLDGRRLDLSRSPAFDVAPALSPDGRWVAFASDRGGRVALYAVRPDATGLRRVSPYLYPEDQLTFADIAWAADSRHLALAVSGPDSHAAVWVGRLDGRGRRDHAVVSSLSWSPDGRRLAFGAYSLETNRHSVRVADGDGRLVWQRFGVPVRTIAWSARGPLAVDTGVGSVVVYDRAGMRLSTLHGRGAAWSPDGRLLAILHGRRLELRPAGTGVPQRSIVALTPGEVAAQGYATLTWATSRRVVVALDDARFGIDLATGARHALPAAAAATSAQGASAYQVSSGATVLLQVTRSGLSPQTVVQAPLCHWGPPFAGVQFGPTGRWLLYQTGCLEPDADLYTVRQDGGGLRRLTNTTTNEADPVWSPNGSMIAYSETEAAGLACKGCPSSIWVMAADGTGRRQLTNPHDAFDTSPTWSPDGKELMFSRATANDFGHLFVVPVGGGPPRPLHIAGLEPRWGPRRLAYVTSRPTLVTSRPDGGDRRVIQSGGQLPLLAWSRDGRLAYTDGNTIHIVGNSPPERVFRVAFSPSSLAWSPDGSTLLLSSTQIPPARTALYVLRTDGTRLRRLTAPLGVTPGGSWR